MPIYKSTLNGNKQPDKKKKVVKEKVKISKEKKKKIFCLSSLLINILLFILSIVNTPIKTFLLGMFGIFAYPLFLTLGLFSYAGISNRKLTANKKYIIALSLSLFFCLTLAHLILTRNISTDSFSTYLVQTYKAKYTGAGLIFSLFSFPMVNYLTVVGAYVLTIIGLVISIGWTIDCIIVARNTPQKQESNFEFNEFKTLNESTNDVKITFEHKQEDIKRRIAKQKLGIEKNESSIISSSLPIDNISEKYAVKKPMTKQEYILTPPEIVIPEKKNQTGYDYSYKQPVPVRNKPSTDDVIVSDAEDFSDAKVIVGKDKSFDREELSNLKLNEDVNELYTTTINQDENLTKKEILAEKVANISYDENANLKNNSNLNSSELDIEESSNLNFDEIIDNYEDEINQLETEAEIKEETNPTIDEYATKPADFNQNSNFSTNKTNNVPFASDVESKEVRGFSEFKEKNTKIEKTIIEEKKPKREKKYYAPYVAPPIDLLNYIENKDIVTDEECSENIDKLENVLNDFKIPAKVKAVQVGPAVTRYEIGMPQGISVKKVQMHSDDIAMALASNGSIRIEAPIPGKNAVGIEVPNRNITAVSMRETIESEDYQKRINPMSFVLGKDINGAIQFCNLDKMPHLLVAGSTGSGKSVCLNTMLISMLYKSGPEDVRLILIDPKTVEFSVYANLPHLLTPNIITTKDQAINALNWAIKEMEYRYTLLQQNEVVNIKDYNNLPIVKNGEVNKLPYIVIVIDELGDLMIDAKRDIEERIMKLAQKSRAAGIHLVIATQRPSVDVITGTIKANLPSRIAFALTNFADSKTVLDMGGAEKLLGRGDMLFKPNDMPEPRRVQGAYISSAEVSAVVKFIKANNSSDFDDDTTKEIISAPETEATTSGGDNQTNNFDPILKDALRWFISANQASITMIQRRFGVGYARAARIVDQMEQAGFISAQDGSKPRQVLITIDEYEQIFN